MQRSTMQNAISAHKVGGIVGCLTKFILKGTLFIEMAGALALLPVFCMILEEKESGWQCFIPYQLFVMLDLIF